MVLLLVLLMLCGLAVNAEGAAVIDEVPATAGPSRLTTIINECNEVPFEVVFVLDSSGSVGQQNFTTMKQFVKSVIGRINIGANATHVGVITFSGYPVMRIRLTESLDQVSLEKAVDAIPYIAGITETNTALDMLGTEGFNGARPGIAKVGIVITDGKSFHPQKTALSAQTAQNLGITLFAVGIGPEINLEELSAIATDPDVEHLFRSDNFNALQYLVMKISNQTCNAKYIETNVTAAPPLNTVTPAYINVTKNATEQCNETLADILFILDTSGSLGEDSFALVKQFVINIIQDLDIGYNFTRVGVITYSSYPILRIRLGQYDDKLVLINAVNRVPYYPGATATDAALDIARVEGFKGERPYTPNIAIVVTDGHSTNPKLTNASAVALKKNGTTVFAIGVGAEIDRSELNLISSSPNSNYVFFVNNFTELSSIENSVIKTTCEVPLVVEPIPVSTTPASVGISEIPAGGSTKALGLTEVPVTGGVTEVPPSTTEEPVATTQQPCITKVADVMFVIDSSGSVGSTNFETIKRFMKQMIDVFDVSKVYTRIGVITYNNAPSLHFGLTKYNTSDEVKAAIDNIVFTSGGTNTGRALETLRTVGFSNDRPGVPDIAIVLTDGLSSDPIATKVQARLLKENGATLIAIGVGNQVNSNELQGIASVDQKTGNSLVYQVGSFEALQTLNSTVPYTSCSVVVATKYPPTPPTTQGTVQTTKKCADEIENCAAYGGSVCSDYAPWANANCAAFCQLCTGAPTTTPTPCADKIPNCFEYGTYVCETLSVSRWAQENCPLYCHFCNPETVGNTTKAGTEQTATATTASTQAISGATASPTGVIITKTNSPVVTATGASHSAATATAAPPSVSGEPAIGSTLEPATATGAHVFVTSAGPSNLGKSESPAPPVSVTPGRPVSLGYSETPAPTGSVTPVGPVTLGPSEKPAPPVSVSPGGPVTLGPPETPAPTPSVTPGGPVTLGPGETPAPPVSVSPGGPVTLGPPETPAPTPSVTPGGPITSGPSETPAPPVSVSPGGPVTLGPPETPVPTPSVTPGGPVTSGPSETTVPPVSVSPGGPVTLGPSETPAPTPSVTPGGPVTSGPSETPAPPGSVSPGGPVTLGPPETPAPTPSVTPGGPVTSGPSETPVPPVSVSPGGPVTLGPPTETPAPTPSVTPGGPVTLGPSETPAPPVSVSPGGPVTIGPPSETPAPTPSVTPGGPVTSGPSKTPVPPVSVSPGGPVTLGPPAETPAPTPSVTPGGPVTSGPSETPVPPVSVSPGGPVTLGPPAETLAPTPSVTPGRPVTSGPSETPVPPVSVSPGGPVTLGPPAETPAPTPSVTPGGPVTLGPSETPAPPVSVSPGGPVTLGPPAETPAPTPSVTPGGPVTLGPSETPSPPVSVSPGGPVTLGPPAETPAPTPSVTPGGPVTSGPSETPVPPVSVSPGGPVTLGPPAETPAPTPSVTPGGPVTLGPSETPAPPVSVSPGGPVTLGPPAETPAPTPSVTPGGPVTLGPSETPSPPVSVSPGGPVTLGPPAETPAPTPSVTPGGPVTSGPSETPVPPVSVSPGGPVTLGPPAETPAPTSSVTPGGPVTSGPSETPVPPVSVSPGGPVTLGPSETPAPTSSVTPGGPSETSAPSVSVTSGGLVTLGPSKTPAPPVSVTPPGSVTEQTPTPPSVSHASATTQSVVVSNSPPSVSVQTETPAVTNSPLTETPIPVSAVQTAAPTKSEPSTAGASVSPPAVSPTLGTGEHSGPTTGSPNVSSLQPLGPATGSAIPPSPTGTVPVATVTNTGQPSPTSAPASVTPTAPTNETCLSKVADVVFVIDSSGSVGFTNFDVIKSFIKQSINVFDIGTEYTRIGMITYNSQPTMQFGLNKYNTTTDLDNAIDGIRFTSGSTNTGAALEMLRKNGFNNERPGVPNIAIVITDGLSSDPDATKLQARLAKAGNILIAIGVGSQVDQTELANIGSVDKDSATPLVYQVTSFQDLQSVQNTVVKIACNVAAATNPPPIVVTTPAPINATGPTGPAETCFDTISNCADYGRGVCYDYAPWAKSHCALFCGVCTPIGGLKTTEHPCVDNIANCHEYGTYICTSSTLISWTKKSCYKYCGLCEGGTLPTEPATAAPTTPEPVCDNKLGNCDEYGGKSMCDNPTYHSWARNNCRKYCGFCTEFKIKPGVTLPNNKTCPDWRLPTECKLVQDDPTCCPIPQCPAGYELTVKLPRED